MINLGRRLALLETARRRHDAPAGPGLAAVLRWAQTHQPTDQWWPELTELVATSPYQDALRDQGPPGLAGLLQEALEWKERNP